MGEKDDSRRVTNADILFLFLSLFLVGGEG